MTDVRVSCSRQGTLRWRFLDRLPHCLEHAPSHSPSRYIACQEKTDRRYIHDTVCRLQSGKPASTMNQRQNTQGRSQLACWLPIRKEIGSLRGRFVSRVRDAVSGCKMKFLTIWRDFPHSHSSISSCNGNCSNSFASQTMSRHSLLWLTPMFALMQTYARYMPRWLRFRVIFLSLHVPCGDLGTHIDGDSPLTPQIIFQIHSPGKQEVICLSDTNCRDIYI